MNGTGGPPRRAGRVSRRASAVAAIGSMLALLAGATPGLAADSGTVDAQVTVAQAAACIELSVSSISFGTLALGAENAPGTPEITVSNCGEANATLPASGTNATGADATWSLVDSAATCADTLGTDNYHLALATPAGASVATLSTENKEVGILAEAGSAAHVAHITTACPGSSGAGQTMSLQVSYLATSEVVEPIVLEELAATDETADAAAAFLLPASKDHDIPANCASDPSIACPGGTPSSPLPQVRVQASNVVADQVPGTLRWNASATAAVTTLQGVPATFSGVSCTLSVNSGNGSSPTYQVTADMNFLSYPVPTGPSNHIGVTNVDITGVETADIAVTGGGLCSFAGSFVDQFIPVLEDQIATYVEGNVCGAPDPAMFMACPVLP
jgi:hypothetical protein